jgi:hypothetical protein
MKVIATEASAAENTRINKDIIKPDMSSNVIDISINKIDILISRSSKDTNINIGLL